MNTTGLKAEQIEKLENLIAEFKKENEPEKWRAERNGYYFGIDDYGDVNEMEEDNHGIDNYYHKTGNYFKTEKECQSFIDYLNKNNSLEKLRAKYEIDKILHRDYMPEPIDWSDYDQVKYYIYYDSGCWVYRIQKTNCEKTQNTLYSTAKPDIDRIRQEIPYWFGVYFGVDR